MRDINTFYIHAEKERLSDWLKNVKLDDLSFLVSKMPEQRFTLMRKGRIIESTEGDILSFVVDGEMANYQEVDGHYDQVFETVREVIKLEARDLKDGRIELHGKVKEIPRVTEKLERSLVILSSKIPEVFSNEE
jgi:hypothetical protein